MTSPAPSEGPSRRRVAGLALLGVGIVAAIIGLASLALDGGGGSVAAPPSTTAEPPSGAAPTDGAPPGGTPGAPTTGPSPTDGIGVPSGAPGAPVPGAPGTPGPTGAGAGPGTAGADGSGPGGAGADGAGAGGTGADGTGAGGTGPGGTGSGGTAGGGAAGGGGGGGGGGADNQVSVVRAPVRVYNNSTISGLAARAAEDFRSAGWPVEEVANYPFGIIPTSTVYYRPGTNEKPAADTLGSEFTLRVEPRFQGLDDASPGVIVIVTNDYQRR